MNLSVVISTRNRAESLERTLHSIVTVADEIVIVDNESTDKTTEVAKKYTKNIFLRPNNLMLNVNKNFGISKAKGDWILCLDDDEVVTEALAREMKEVTQHSLVAGFWIPRKNIIFGKWIEHGIWWPDRQLRLFRRNHGKYPEKHVHEHMQVDGPTDVLVAPYIHYNYHSISQYLWKMQSIYTDSDVQKFVAMNYRVDWRDAIRFPVSDFVKLYFAQRGYKDGLHGLVLALLQSFYSFIVFAKLWEQEKFPPMAISTGQVTEELSRSRKEIQYWSFTTKIKQSNNPLTRLWLKCLRRVCQL